LIPQPPVSIPEAAYPALYEAADSSSSAAQARFLRVTFVRLVGLVVAAVGGALRFVVADIDLLGLVGFLGIVVAMAAELRLLASRPDRVWYEGRAAAESAKTLAWRYMVGGQPFPVSGDEGAIDRDFLARLNELLSDLRDLHLAPSPAPVYQITEEMRRVRGLSLAERVLTYRCERVENQQLWYQARSKSNGDKSRRWSLLVIGLEAVGLVAAAMKAFDVVALDLLGIVAAAAAAITAWGQARQFEILSRAYFVAGQELAAINSQVSLSWTEEEWSRFVKDAEEAISREHTLWRATRGLKQLMVLKDRRW
jgi:hypothetical protein